MDILTTTDIVGETMRVADAAPGLEADEGTVGFMGCPDAIGFSLRAADLKHLVSLLVAEYGFSYLTSFKHQGIVCECINFDGHLAGDADISIR